MRKIIIALALLSTVGVAMADPAPAVPSARPPAPAVLTKEQMDAQMAAAEASQQQARDIQAAQSEAFSQLSSGQMTRELNLLAQVNLLKRQLAAASVEATVQRKRADDAEAKLPKGDANPN